MIGSNDEGVSSMKASETGGSVPRKTIRSEELLGGENDIAIDHGGEIYRLRRTRNGKLILTK